MKCAALAQGTAPVVVSLRPTPLQTPSPIVSDGGRPPHNSERVQVSIEAPEYRVNSHLLVT